MSFWSNPFKQTANAVGEGLNKATKALGKGIGNIAGGAAGGVLGNKGVQKGLTKVVGSVIPDQGLIQNDTETEVKKSGTNAGVLIGVIAAAGGLLYGVYTYAKN